MTLSLYFDQHIPGAIARGLGRRGVDVLTTQGDGTSLWRDGQFLERATSLGRVMVSEDDNFLIIADRWLNEGRTFTGLVKGKNLNRMIGRAIEDLMVVADGDALLMNQRRDSGRWALIGGEVEPDESLANALCREAGEETGPTVTAFTLFGTSSDPSRIIRYPGGRAVRIVTSK